MYDSVATLKAYGTPTFDAYGNEVENVTETEVFVQPRGVYQSEFYNAAQLGLKPSLTLYLANRDDYDGQKVLEFEGKEYNVIRVDWNAQRDGISLICEERVDNGN
jgi:SPP1 family predicted phage head-tail adaptor